MERARISVLIGEKRADRWVSRAAREGRAVHAAPLAEAELQEDHWTLALATIAATRESGFTNPLIGTVAWLVPPLAVVHHVGRRSGRRYGAPVVAIRIEGGFVIPMTYGRDVDWARNMVHAGGCELERLGSRVRLRNPRIVGFRAAGPRLPALLRPFFRATNFPGVVLLDDAPSS